MAFNISIQHDLKKMKRGLTALELQALPQTTVRTLMAGRKATSISGAATVTRVTFGTTTNRK